MTIDLFGGVKFRATLKKSLGVISVEWTRDIVGKIAKKYECKATQENKVKVNNIITNISFVMFKMKSDQVTKKTELANLKKELMSIVREVK